jgi:hypothetical protein
VDPPAVAVFAVSDNDSTGRFLGFGALVANNIVALYPTAGRPVALARRMRCVLPWGPTGQQVVDGVPAEPAEHGGSPPAVLLAEVPEEFRAAPDPWGGLTSEATPEQLLEQIRTYLEAASVAAPPKAPPPQLVRPPKKKKPDPDDEQLKPPWCAIWPGAWGC